jgi:signal transduction histidine kinase
MTTNAMRRPILVVDDDAGFCDNLTDILSLEGYDVESVGDCEKAIKAAARSNPPVVLLDFKLPDGSGPSLIDRLKERNPDCVCIIITAYADLDAALAALHRGAYHFLQKPFQLPELLGLLNRAFETVDLRAAKRSAEEALTQRNIELEHMIEEQKRLEAQLILTQKLEAIGTLAGGVAHDFNNVLAGIIGYIELALLQLSDHPEPDPQITAFLNKALEACQRAKLLIEQILAFSHQAEKECRPVVLGPIIKESLKFLRSTLPATINIHCRIEAQLHAVMADATQVHRVIMNLCTNAAHAMQSSGGDLSLTLGELEGEKWLKVKRRLPSLPPAPCLHLAVADTGSGIDPAIREKIFNPYFTTKPKGEGTGLGLAVVRGIVESCDGAIDLESQLGVGTTFHIYLPAIETALMSVRETHPHEILGGEERILLVDDEPNILEVGGELLSRLGYRVSTAEHGGEALKRFQEDPQAIDLVITDMTMPEMTGDILAQALLAVRPELPIILCTGFSEKISPERAQSIGIKGFIMKPIDSHSMAEAIRLALDGSCGFRR